TFGEAGGVTEEPGHDVRAAIAVLDNLTQNHVAAAFAVHGARLRKTTQAFCEILCRCKRLCMQFRIAARQPTTVGALRRRFGGQWKQWPDPRAGAPPRSQNVRINKTESPILRQRNALPGRRQETTLTVASRLARERRGGRDDRIKIEVAFRRRAKPLD